MYLGSTHFKFLSDKGEGGKLFILRTVSFATPEGSPKASSLLYTYALPIVELGAFPCKISDFAYCRKELIHPPRALIVLLNQMLLERRRGKRAVLQN